jgi:hypothetical protein
MMGREGVFNCPSICGDTKLSPSPANKVKADYINYLCFSDLLFLCYVKTLSVRRPYDIDDRAINEYGVIGGMRTDKGNGSSLR